MPLYALVVKWISRWSTEPLFWVRPPAGAPKKSAVLPTFFYFTISIPDKSISDIPDEKLFPCQYLSRFGVAFS